MYKYVHVCVRSRMGACDGLEQKPKQCSPNPPLISLTNHNKPHEICCFRSLGSHTLVSGPYHIVSAPEHFEYVP